MKKYLSFFTLLLMCNISIWAQQTDTDADLVQFSGMVLDGSDTNLYPVPYANVLLTEDGRGTYSDLKGFFSIVAKKGDVVTFSAIGYKDVDFIIPDTLTESRYSLVQLMSQDTINLPAAIVFPWPSREHFKLEFLAMDVTNEMQERAVANLAENALERMRETVPSDGDEHADLYMREQARSYYYIGQTPPMNIFNPFAWKQFFEAWKRGDFKKKKNK